MDFWKNILDPTKNRKIKGFIVATVLVIFDFIDSSTWAIAFTAFVSAITYDKVTKKK